MARVASSLTMIRCPSCSQPQSESLICTSCGAPIGAELDSFAALGIPRRLVIDLAELERSYHELGRRLHPDRFANSAASIRDASLRATAQLTRAYRTLRDPISRGLYWLELNGAKLADNNKQVPADLAALVFETQENLAELRERRSRGLDDGKIAATVRDGLNELRSLMAHAEAALQQNFERWDSGEARDDRHLLDELKAALSRIAYLRTLIRDVERALETAGQPATP